MYRLLQNSKNKNKMNFDNPKNQASIKMDKNVLSASLHQSISRVVSQSFSQSI